MTNSFTLKLILLTHYNMFYVNYMLYKHFLKGKNLKSHECLKIS